MEGIKNWQNAVKLMKDGAKALRDPKNIYRPRDDDVIIVGSPKSGTTWLQQILHQIRSKGDESFKDIIDVSWFLVENGTLGGDFDVNSDQPFKPRVFKHHEAYGVMPTTRNQKKIVIMRDPYDAIYSFTKFVDRWFGGTQDVPDDIMAKKVEKMKELQKIATWWAEKDRDSSLFFVFYEDLSKNLKFMIKRIAQFVEIPLTDKELDRIYPLCTFEYMSKNKQKFQHMPVSRIWAKSLGIPQWSLNISMVREDGGRTGDGSKNCGPKVRAILDQLWQKYMQKQFGYANYHELYNENTLLKNTSKI